MGSDAYGDPIRAPSSPSLFGVAFVDEQVVKLVTL